MDFEVRSNTKFSWSYIYELEGKTHEIWAESVDALKRKVLSKSLPWDDDKVPQARPVNIICSHIGLREPESSPVEFRRPWCKSNYKRY